MGSLGCGQEVSQMEHNASVLLGLEQVQPRVSIVSLQYRIGYRYRPISAMNNRLSEYRLKSLIGASLLVRLRSCQKAMGSCTAQCIMLLFRANTVVRESAKFELARLKKEEEEEEEENRFWQFDKFLARYFRDGYSQHCCFRDDFSRH